MSQQTKIEEFLKSGEYNETSPNTNKSQCLQCLVEQIPRQSENNIDTQWTPELALTLSTAVLIFGVIVFSFMTYLINKKHDPNDILRIFALPLIVVSAIFLIVVGYSQEQIAPVMGILGTIAGYLLGNKHTNNEKTDEESSKNQVNKND